MPRLIDAEELRPKLTWLNEYDYLHVLNIVKSLPTVDIDAITESHERIGYDKGFRDGYAQATVDAVPTDFHDKCMEIEIQKRMDLELNAEPVVRCKDCIYYHDDICKVQSNNDRGYCAWGERKEDGKTE